jgi:hypothetical protein
VKDNQKYDRKWKSSEKIRRNNERKIKICKRLIIRKEDKSLLYVIIK